MTLRLPHTVSALALTLLFGCSRSSSEASKVQQKPALPPEPVVKYKSADAGPGQKIDHGELSGDVDEARGHLHAQHHPHKVLETRRVPGSFQSPAMTDVKEFALSKKDLDVINRNLTIGITYTAPIRVPVNTCT